MDTCQCVKFKATVLELDFQEVGVVDKGRREAGVVETG